MLSPEGVLHPVMEVLFGEARLLPHNPLLRVTQCQ
jgi:hypothetical protein